VSSEELIFTIAIVYCMQFGAIAGVLGRVTADYHLLLQLLLLASQHKGTGISHLRS
jgi:hypothetical protein